MKIYFVPVFIFKYSRPKINPWMSQRESATFTTVKQKFPCWKILKPKKWVKTNEGFAVGRSIKILLCLIPPLPNIYFTMYVWECIVGASQSFFLFVLRFPINISAQTSSLTQSNVSSLWDRKAFKVLSSWSWKTDWSKNGNYFNCVLARNLKQTNTIDWRRKKKNLDIV